MNLTKKALFALSEALPPISAQIISDVSEAFRSLEVDRTELENFKNAVQVIEDFLNDYRIYASVVTKRSAEILRQFHNDYVRIQKELHDADAALKSTESESAKISDELGRLKIEQTTLIEEEKTLQLSPVLEHARELENAQREQEVMAKEQQRALRQAEQLENRKNEKFALCNRLEAEVAEARTSFSEIEQILKRQAEEAGIPFKSQEGFQKGLLKSVQEYLEYSKRIKKLNEELSQAQQQKREARRLEEGVQSDLNNASQSYHEQTLVLKQKIEDFLSNFRKWKNQLKAISLPDLKAEEEDFPFWVMDLRMEQNSQLLDQVRAAEQAVLTQNAQDSAQVTHILKQVLQKKEDLLLDLQKLKSGKEETPPALYFRDGVRSSRPGAPLWRLCDFKEGLSISDQAGLEAALEASGLLDAWIMPNGTVLGESDTFIEIGCQKGKDLAKSKIDSDLEPNLSRVLTYTSNPYVPEEIVHQILSRIGLGLSDASHWVSVEGGWKNGILSGSWKKQIAQYIGQTAREQERQRRIQEAKKQLASLDEEISLIHQQIEQLAKNNKAIHAEMNAMPGVSDLQKLLSHVFVLGKQVSQIQEKLQSITAQVEVRIREEEQALARRNEDAADFGLSKWVNRIEEYTDLLREIPKTVADYRSHSVVLQSKTELLENSKSEYQTALQEVLETQEWIQETQSRLAQIQGRLNVIQELLSSPETQAVLAKLSEVRLQLKKLNAGETRLHKILENCVKNLGAFEQQVKSLMGTLETAGRNRLSEIEKFRILIGTGLVQTAFSQEMPEELKLLDLKVDSPVKDVIEAVRLIYSAITYSSEQINVDRREKTLTEQFSILQNRLLPLGYSPKSDSINGARVITIPLHGKSCSVNTVQDEFQQEVQNRQLILDNREKEILENHLIDEVSTQLHDFLRRAEAWVNEVNFELSDRPMSTGMLLRFSWNVKDDGPSGLSGVRKLLLRSGGTWSLKDRDLIAQFLQQQIRNERAKNEFGTWQQHLSVALDYRNWHEFQIERKQEGTWVRLTKRTHGTGSGGEKAIALTLPQFAGLAAHYRSAAPTAPRMVNSSAWTKCL